MVAVLGLSESESCRSQRQIEQLGTNLLTVEPATGFGAGDGDAARRSGRQDQPDRARRGRRRHRHARRSCPLRNDIMSDNETKGLTAIAADIDLLDTLRGTVAEGAWLDEPTATYPAVVLGSVAAQRSAIDRRRRRRPMIYDRWTSGSP